MPLYGVVKLATAETKAFGLSSRTHPSFNDIPTYVFKFSEGGVVSKQNVPVYPQAFGETEQLDFCCIHLM